VFISLIVSVLKLLNCLH